MGEPYIAVTYDAHNCTSGTIFDSYEAFLYHFLPTDNALKKTFFYMTSSISKNGLLGGMHHVSEPILYGLHLPEGYHGKNYFVHNFTDQEPYPEQFHIAVNYLKAEVYLTYSEKQDKTDTEYQQFE